MGEVVNLRLARKRKARAEKEQVAERNRTLFGRTKTERILDAAEKDRAREFLDGHRRDRGGDGQSE